VGFKRGFSAILVIATITLILGVIVTEFYINRKEKPLEQTYQSSPAPIQETKTPEPSQTSTAIISVKRQFDPTKKFYNDEEYPAEIINVKESDLEGMKCSDWYSDDYSGGYAKHENDFEVKLTDQKLLGLFNTLKNSEKVGLTQEVYEVSAGQYCETEDNRTIIEYEFWGGGGGGANTSFIGLAKNDGSIDKIATIPNDGAAYFSCDYILQLTTQNDLYLNCGGGDGDCGAASIYSINLLNHEKKLILKCSSCSDKTSCSTEL